MYHVYLIYNLITDKLYVGKTKNPSRRWYIHKWIAKHPLDHRHRYLHRAIAKYGNDSFVFRVVKSTSEESESFLTETAWYDLLISLGYGLYNEIRPEGKGSPSGENHPLRGIPKEQHPRFGQRHTKQSKRLMSEGKKGNKNPRAKLNKNDIIKIRKLYKSRGYTERSLAKMFGISKSHAHRIISKQNWVHI